jgi:type IV pilus assembly protein PilV
MSRPPRFHRRPATPRGYTAIEVLMAMTVMAIGAAGVISMQKTSMQANLDARKTDMAAAIARTWVERVKRDAMQWTQPGPSNPGALPGNLARAPLLQHGVSNLNTWFLPNQYIGLNPPLSPGFDILGRDLPATALTPSTTPPQPGALFCTAVRMSQLAGDLYRVDIRVLWPRGVSNDQNLRLPGGGVCAGALGNPPDPLIYHSLYVSTAVRENAL